MVQEERIEGLGSILSYSIEVPTHCLLLFAIEAGDLLDLFKIFVETFLLQYFSPHLIISPKSSFVSERSEGQNEKI